MSTVCQRAKIKKFIHLYIPVTTCNLHCHYCYIYHLGLFKSKLPEFKYSPEVVKKAFSQKRLGGACHINICGGGETLLPPQMTDYIRVLLEEGHYVGVVTNGTITKRFDELTALDPELLSRLFFKFSYHYLQLKERRWLDRFFSNIRKMRDVGCSFTVELTPNDETIPYIEEMKQRCIDELGAPPHITIARNEIAPSGDRPILTKLPTEEYYKVWGDSMQSAMFDYKRMIFGQKRCEFCYAGLWSIDLDLGSGDMRRCYDFPVEGNFFENIDRPLNLKPVGYGCRMPHCYNGHVFLTFGLIPELESITYAQLRNKTCADGTEWLQPKVKEFFSSKLKESNEEYTSLQKAAWWVDYAALRMSEVTGKIVRGVGRRLFRK